MSLGGSAAVGRSTMLLTWVRRTSADRVAGVLRLLLGVLFVMTGVMKLVVPMLAEAWSRQFLPAGLPLYEFARWAVPFVEMGIGAALVLGLFARLAGLIVTGIMAVATYVHMAVDDPSLFPLQPSEPIVPVAVMVMTEYVVWRGAGAWSQDLKATQAVT